MNSGSEVVTWRCTAGNRLDLHGVEVVTHSKFFLSPPDFIVLQFCFNGIKLKRSWLYCIKIYNSVTWTGELINHCQKFNNFEGQNRGRLLHLSLNFLRKRTDQYGAKLRQSTNLTYHSFTHNRPTLLKRM